MSALGVLALGGSHLATDPLYAHGVGWWVLIAFVPVIGGLWYLIECGFLPGTVGANNYGADPLTTA